MNSAVDSLVSLAGGEERRYGYDYQTTGKSWTYTTDRGSYYVGDVDARVTGQVVLRPDPPTPGGGDSRYEGQAPPSPEDRITRPR
jgi:hypothetical protein